MLAVLGLISPLRRDICVNGIEILILKERSESINTRSYIKILGSCKAPQSGLIIISSLSVLVFCRCEIAQVSKRSEVTQSPHHCSHISRTWFILHWKIIRSQASNSITILPHSNYLYLLNSVFHALTVHCPLDGWIVCFSLEPSLCDYPGEYFDCLHLFRRLVILGVLAS